MQHKFINSRFFQIMDYILRLIILNFLVVIPSFSFFVLFGIFFKDYANSYFIYLTLIPMLFYLFPAVVSCHDVIKQYECNETNTIFKDFFKSFKKHYVKSLLISLLIYLAIYLLMYSSYFFYNNLGKGILYLVGLILDASFWVMFIFILMHIPLTFVYFDDLRIIDTIKVSFVLAFKSIFKTFVMVLLCIITVVLDIWNNYYLFLVGFSLIIFLNVKMSFGQYIKILRKVE